MPVPGRAGSGRRCPHRPLEGQGKATKTLAPRSVTQPAASSTSGLLGFCGTRDRHRIQPWAAPVSLVKRLAEESDAGRAADLAQVLYDQALLAEGGKLEDPATFVKRINKLLLELSV